MDSIGDIKDSTRFTFTLDKAVKETENKIQLRKIVHDEVKPQN